MGTLTRDPLFAQGVALYDAGRYWHAHEAWEALWRAATDGALRRLLQGLIQVAAALYKLAERGDVDACLRLLARAAGKLDGLPDDLGGVDVRALREGVGRCAGEIARDRAAGDRFDRGSAPRVAPVGAALPPLADLHRHLDGSLRASTVAELAAREGVAVPRDLPFVKGMGLLAALERFAFTLSLLQTEGAVRRAAAEACDDAAAEGVTTLELRFAPQLHGRRGLRVEAVIDAALEGVAGRAGLLLCGLYGEPPAVLRALVDAARDRPGVVGIDLAGAPVPGDHWGLDDYATPFAMAERAGLGRTVHAGEGRAPAEIRAAIEVLHAQRIGHGTTLLDDPAVLDLVLARGVTIEACLTSNVHTGAVADVDAHPLPRWLAAGVRACVCTDNTLLSSVDAPGEHWRAARIPGMSDALLAAAVAHGHAGAFRRASMAAAR